MILSLVWAWLFDALLSLQVMAFGLSSVAISWDPVLVWKEQRRPPRRKALRDFSARPGQVNRKIASKVRIL